jgi:DNA-binding response OmpR family regulator
MTSVLVIDGDGTLCASISHALRDEGLETVTAAGQSGLHEALAATYEVIILGHDIPNLAVRQFLIRLRAEHVETPVLLISTPGREEELAAGLKMGADGYIVKPISLLVLRAQIRAVLRRGEAANRGNPEDCGELANRQVLHLGPLTVNLLAKQASVEGNGHFVEFSKREFALLRVLASHPRTPLSRQELLEAAWGDKRAATPNTVEVYIGYLRKRLRVLGVDQCIETCRGRGYQLNPPALP